MPGKPIIRAFFDEPTNTISYLVADPTTRKAAIISGPAVPGPGRDVPGPSSP